MKVKQILPVFILIMLSGCKGNKSGSDIDINSLLAENSGNNLEISAESMNSIIESIPSPMEIAMVIRQTGTGFNENILNPHENASLYTTDLSKAMGIGIYSGDLGYINMFEKSMLTLNYLNTIRKLADQIKIGQFFDFETIKRLASNSDKMDSLIYLSTINFNRMDSFLRNQRRSNMSILMVSGTWIEGLFIATTEYEAGKNPETMEWIGNQKVIIDQLLLGLSAYKSDPYFKNIVGDMTRLKEVYDKVTITYEYHEPESVEKDGRLVIIDKSTSTVNITAAQLEEIGNLVKEIRTRLVSNS
jgi:hypothetical protein